MPIITLKLSNPTASEIEAAICSLNRRPETPQNGFEKLMDTFLLDMNREASDTISQGEYVMVWDEAPEHAQLGTFVCELTNDPDYRVIAEMSANGQLHKWQNCCLLEDFKQLLTSN
jgi:hypothetical protein